jgi:predicted nucleic acid-binding protein
LFANRYTALADACVLAGVLRRNLLLTLARAEFFRLRWSQPIMDETQSAIETILARKKNVENSAGQAVLARAKMEQAFEDAMVDGFDHLLAVCGAMPDTNDRHVLAAAIKTRAHVIVTDNLKHFPDTALTPFGIEARSADVFIADTAMLDISRAVAAVQKMRLRFGSPPISVDDLFIKMEAQGLTETVDALEPYAHLL